MTKQFRLLIVDDSKVDQMIIKDILSTYETISAYDGIEALELLSKDSLIDMIILDLNMPRMDGFQVLEAIQREYAEREFSVIILTNYEEIENEIKGLDLGAVDYVRKPLNSESLLKRIQVHLNLIHAKQEIHQQNLILEERVRVRTEQLERSRDVTANALIGLLEVRDIESSNHTKRTMLMMRLFTEHLAKKEEYKTRLTKSYIEALYKTAPLHDIGKVGIKDDILLKPGKLTVEEFEIMKNHVNYGVNALKNELSYAQMDEFLTTAVKIIAAHHEKYDGSGYPNGLSGKAIPLEGRLMAIIDVYDAITSKRVYKSAQSHEEAIELMLMEKNKHFDPELVDAFIEIKKDIFEISMRYKQEN
jgi:putative two-component system response regulator